MDIDVADDEQNTLNQIESVVSFISQFDSCVVALSAGVDSAVVAKAARLALGDQATAVTAESPSLPTGELQQAQQLAQLIGISHQVLQTDEFSNPEYLQNQGDRCYHCKSELYRQMDNQIELQVPLLKNRVLLNGTNADDLSDYRPGLIAASENNVRSPLAECQVGKASVRAIAKHWELPVWDKPAGPCLSSRVAYGEQVTPERLRMIDKAEQYLKEQSIVPVRVRYHRGDLARIEVPLKFIAVLSDPETRIPLEQHFQKLGFQFVTLDLSGFQSGSLNQLLQIDIPESS